MQILRFAKLLRSRTPISLRQLLFKISFHHYTAYVHNSNNDISTSTTATTAAGIDTASAAATGAASAGTVMSPLSSHSLLDVQLSDEFSLECFGMYISDLPCLLLPAAEIITQVYHDILENSSIKYLLFDLRSREEYDNGHLPCAIHIDTDTLLNDIQQRNHNNITTFLQPYKQLKDCHLCFIPKTTNTFQNVIYYYQQQQQQQQTSGITAVDKASDSQSATQISRTSSSNSNNMSHANDKSATKVARSFIDSSEIISSDDEDAEEQQNAANEETESESNKHSKQKLPSVVGASVLSNTGRPPLSFFSSASLLDQQTARIVSLFIDNHFAHVSICEGKHTNVIYPTCLFNYTCTMHIIHQYTYVHFCRS